MLNIEGLERSLHPIWTFWPIPFRRKILDPTRKNSTCSFGSINKALKPIRIVLAELPRMLIDIIRSEIRKHPHMEIVGEVACRDKLGDMIDKTLADAVIISCEPSELPNIGERMFTKHPNIKIVGLTEHGREGFLYELAPRKVSIGESSPEGLLNTIDQAVTQSMSRH